MSRSGNVWDNAAMESFFSPLKVERIARKCPGRKPTPKPSLRLYIERFYNPKLRHSTIGYLSPMEFERQCWISFKRGSTEPAADQIVQLFPTIASAMAVPCDLSLRGRRKLRIEKHHAERTGCRICNFRTKARSLFVSVEREFLGILGRVTQITLKNVRHA
jgi:hypothetical protein